MTDFTYQKQPFDSLRFGSMVKRCWCALGLFAALTTLSSCGNVDNIDESGNQSAGGTSFITGSTVGGTVSGLQGTVVLQNNAGDNLTVDADGSITFAALVSDGQTYSVSVLRQPANQTCTVSSGAGTVSDNSVNNVTVVCATDSFAVSGAVSGLVGSLVVQNNNADSLTISSDGSFAFADAVAEASPYLITIQRQPAGQSCSIVNGSGAIQNGAVSDVLVSCVTGTHIVAGTITGLQGSAVLRNNGTDDLVVTSNGAFTFATATPYGSTYAITEVWKQNAGQTCSVSNGTGTVTADVTTIALNCVAHATPRFAYVANYSSSSVSQYTIGADGSLSAMSPATVVAGGIPIFLTVSPGGQYVYVANSGDSTVSQYTVGADGALSAMTPATVATGSSPASVTVSPSGQYAYVANRTGSVSQYTIGADGALSAMSPASVASVGGPFAVTVDPSGQYAYVANGDDSVSQYTIGASGALSPMSPATVPAGATPFSVTVDPSGRYAYVANLNGLSVSQYAIGADGALSAMSPASVAAGPGSATMTIDPSGQYAYVANSSGDSVSQYTIGADGALSAMSPASVTNPGGPTSVTVDPSGQFAYVVNRLANTVSQYMIDANGALNAMSPATLAAGNFPYSVATVGGP